MRFALRPLAIAMLLPSALLAGCGHTVISPAASPCSDLLPSDWLGGVPPAPLPESAKLADGHDDARPWQAWGIEQTGQLEKANGRYADGIGIVKRCEARDAAAVKRARPKFLGLF